MSRGFSTKFEDHIGLIHRISRKFWAQSLATKTPIEYDDIFAEASLAYVKCLEGYSPDRGITFTAYMGRAIFNHLSRQHEREFIASHTIFKEFEEGEREVERPDDGTEVVEAHYAPLSPDKRESRAKVPTISNLSMDATVDMGDGDESSDLHDVIRCVRTRTPEEIVEGRQVSAQTLRNLSRAAQAFVRELVSPTPKLMAYIEETNAEGGRQITDVNITTIARCHNVDRNKVRRVREELSQAYGVRL